MIFRSKQKSKFTIVPNKTIENGKLSLRARGLLVYLLSKPNNWNVSLEHLCTITTEGKGAVRTALQELINEGYVERSISRVKGGKMNGYEYWVYDVAKKTAVTVVQLADDGSTVDGLPSSGFCTLISTEVVSTDNNKTITTNVVKAKPKVNEDIEAIVTGFQKTFNVDHKQDRRAAQWFRQKYGVETTQLMFTKAFEAQANDRFCPRTPSLKDFWYQIPKLQDYFRRVEQTSGITEINF